MTMVGMLMLNLIVCIIDLLKHVQVQTWELLLLTSQFHLLVDNPGAYSKNH